MKTEHPIQPLLRGTAQAIDALLEIRSRAMFDLENLAPDPAPVESIYSSELAPRAQAQLDKHNAAVQLEYLAKALVELARAAQHEGFQRR